MEYLVELIEDKKNLQMFPKLFRHVDRVVDQEIAHVRSSLFQFNFAKGGMNLPDPVGDPIVIREKVYIPVDDHPDFNFVGRILGPRGMTAKQLEQETGCKIMIRGKGSVRDRSRDATRRARPELGEDNLHVLVQCEDAPNRARKRVDLAVKHVSKLLIPMQEGSDELKRKQLMELSLINGTYKPIRSPNPFAIPTDDLTLVQHITDQIEADTSDSDGVKSPTGWDSLPFKLQTPPKRRSLNLPMSSSSELSHTSSMASDKSWCSSSPPSTTDFSLRNLSLNDPFSPDSSSGSILRAYMPGYFPPSPILLDDSHP